ncbi:MAG: DUF2190 family protein [Gemmobacter sp.]|uniref:DUF2190 family protein n=1 Tax=Gemmobacter sp. TaxID=1898957 RepID=UPI00391B2DE4
MPLATPKFGGWAAIACPPRLTSISAKVSDLAKNFIQAGYTLTIPAPAVVTSGGVVIAGAIIGVAQGDAASGASVDAKTSGVWELPKVGADVATLGVAIYWNSTFKLATVTASGNTKIGVAVKAAGAGVASIKVRLSGFCGATDDRCSPFPRDADASQARPLSHRGSGLHRHRHNPVRQTG